MNALPIPSLRLRWRSAPALVLLASLALTLVVWVHERGDEQRLLRSAFDASRRELQVRLDRSLSEEEHVLRGVEGLFAANPEADDTQIARYVSALPGADARGLSLVRPSAELSALIAPALERARDGGRVIFADDQLILPIYRDGVVPAGAAERRERLLAWVRVPLDLNRRLAELYGDLPPGLSLALYGDGVASGAEQLGREASFYRKGAVAAPLLFTSREVLKFGGHALALVVQADERFADGHFGQDSLRVLLAGVLLSALLSLLAWQQGHATRRAHRLAERMTDALRSSEQRWAFALEGAGDGVWDWRLGSDQITGSLRWKTLMGLPLDGDEPLMAMLPLRAHPEDQSRLLAELQRCREGQADRLTGEFRVSDGNGGWQWVLMRGTVVEHGPRAEPRRVMGTLSDINTRRESEERVRFMALHDPLTELANRAHFDERMHFALANARRYNESIGLILLDLDRFKPVNDQHGHAVGDQLLQTVARRIKSSVRETDTVGRIGGDEFVVLLTGPVTRESAKLVADKIYNTLAQPMDLGGLRLEITCSIGLALYPDDGGDELTLTKAADDAMYRNKRTGRSVFTGSESVTKT